MAMTSYQPRTWVGAYPTPFTGHADQAFIQQLQHFGQVVIHCPRATTANVNSAAIARTDSAGQVLPDQEVRAIFMAASDMIDLGSGDPHFQAVEFDYSLSYRPVDFDAAVQTRDEFIINGQTYGVIEPPKTHTQGVHALVGLVLN